MKKISLLIMILFLKISFASADVRTSPIKKEEETFFKMSKYTDMSEADWVQGVQACDNGNSKACISMGAVYRVVGVASDDTLSVRVESDYKAKLLGVLPPDAENIQILKCIEKSKKSIWCKVSHPSIVGWVNKRYIMHNEEVLIANSLKGKYIVTPKKSFNIGILIQEEEEGILISDVARGSPAHLSGLKSGDMILSINNKKINNLSSVTSSLHLPEKTTNIPMMIIRGSKKKDITLLISKSYKVKNIYNDGLISYRRSDLKELHNELCKNQEVLFFKEPMLKAYYLNTKHEISGYISNLRGEAKTFKGRTATFKSKDMNGLTNFIRLELLNSSIWDSQNNKYITYRTLERKCTGFLKECKIKIFGTLRSTPSRPPELNLMVSYASYCGISILGAIYGGVVMSHAHLDVDRLILLNSDDEIESSEVMGIGNEAYKIYQDIKNSF